MALVVIFFSQPKTSCPEEVFQDAFPRGKKYLLPPQHSNQPIPFIPSRATLFVRVDFKHSLSKLYKLIQTHNKPRNENFQKDARRSQKSLPAYPRLHDPHTLQEKNLFSSSNHSRAEPQTAGLSDALPTLHHLPPPSFGLPIFPSCLVEHTTSRLPTPSPTLPSPNKTIRAFVMRMAQRAEEAYGSL